MNNLNDLKAKSFQVAAFTGACTLLERLNLDFLNVRFIGLEKLPKYAEQLVGLKAKEECEASISQWLEKWNKDYIICLVPISLNKVLRHGVYANLEQLLLTLYPCEFRHYSLTNFKIYNEFVVFGGEIQTNVFPHRQCELSKPLSFDEADILLIEEFIRNFFENSIPAYLQMCIKNYIAHYYQWDFASAFVSLSIAMEALAEGTESVLYKIKRNLAVINASTEEEGIRIYDNIGKIYALRSKIVHGEQFDTAFIREYLPYAQNLVASSIIELLEHKIEKRKTLCDRLTYLGFGQKTLISEKYNTKLPKHFCSINLMHLTPSKLKTKA